jgi:hypothetical protein
MNFRFWILDFGLTEATPFSISPARVFAQKIDESHAASHQSKIQNPKSKI